jgi:hypothetical protein
LLPTLLAGIGQDAPEHIDGCNALDRACRDRPHFAELRLDGRSLASVIVDPWKVIVDQTGRARELYDLASDPLERRNLTFADPAKLAEMERILSAVLSRSAYGWHLRVCGGDDVTEMAFRVHGAGVNVTEEALEEEDSVTTASAQTDVIDARFTLRPYDASREFFGRLVTQRFRDEDEVRIEQEASAEGLRVESDAELRYVLGASKKLQTGRSIDLFATRSAAVVPGTTVIACPPAPPAPAAPADAALAKKVPLLSIWYVEPPTALSAARVDPAVVDRLRALGYVW